MNKKKKTKKWTKCLYYQGKVEYNTFSLQFHYPVSNMTPAIKHIQVEGSVRTCITDINVSRCCYFQKEFKYARSHPQSPSPPLLKCNTSLPQQMRDPCLWSEWNIPQIYFFFKPHKGLVNLLCGSPHLLTRRETAIYCFSGLGAAC